MGHFPNWKYLAYQVYSELASRYYTYKYREKPKPSAMECQICGKPGHVERLCPNAWRMGFLDQQNNRQI